MRNQLLLLSILILLHTSATVPNIYDHNATDGTIISINPISSHTFQNGSVSGYVNDSYGNPVEGATVCAICGGYKLTNMSDSSGYYYIGDVPIVDCYWNISASKHGYKTSWIEMSIDVNTTHDFILTPFHVIYIDDDNTQGPWDGSRDHPYQFIQDGIDNASDGDTVFVHNGIYYENLIVYKSICLIGENKNISIIDGSMNQTRDVICVTASHVDIEKFTIKNGKNGILIDDDYGIVDKLNIVENIISDNIQCGVFFFRSGYNNILKNIISNNKYGLIAYKFCNNIIFGNIIYSSSEAGIHLTSAVNAGNCVNNTISYNTLQNNGQGISLFTSHNNKINRNNFYENNKDAVFVWSNSNNWNYNYWNRARLTPKPIFGRTGINLPIIPWVNFDWYPAKEPYDILITEMS